MTADQPAPRLLSIGEFARLSGLTPKALRLYDQQALLQPAKVDAASGYRYYEHAQLLPARLIAMLRAADMSLIAIAGLLGSYVSGDSDTAATRLTGHLEALEAEHSARRFLIQHINALLRKEDAPVFTIETRTVPAQRGMAIQRRLKADQTDDFVAEAKATFAKHLGGRLAAGPFTVIFHGIVDRESDGPIEAFLPCGDDVEPTDGIGIRTEPAHEAAYTTITKAQWEFPAILAAYDAVACSPTATGRPTSSLSCREVYLAEPDAIGSDDAICDVVFPLG